MTNLPVREGIRRSRGVIAPGGPRGGGKRRVWSRGRNPPCVQCLESGGCSQAHGSLFFRKLIILFISRSALQMDLVLTGLY